MQRSSDNLPSYLQTNIIAQMFIGGEGAKEMGNNYYMIYYYYMIYIAPISRIESEAHIITWTTSSDDDDE